MVIMFNVTFRPAKRHADFRIYSSNLISLFYVKMSPMGLMALLSMCFL